MRAPLGPVGRYLADLCRAVARGWNSFWYTPVDPTLLGLIRLLTGTMLLYNHAIWGLVLKDFFGPDSWLSQDLVADIFRAHQPRLLHSGNWVPARGLGLARVCPVDDGPLLVHDRPLDPHFVHPVARRRDFICASRSRGPLRPRQGHRDAHALPGDRPLGLPPSRSTPGWPAAAAPAIKGPARPPSVAANFTLRLINVHMCIIYLVAGLSKLQGTAWWNGQAMWMVLGNLEYQAIDMTWLAWHPWLIELLSHFTLFWELTFCVLIWVPILRPLVLFESLVLHLAIGACMGLWTFSLVMLIAGCASFLARRMV